jgi:hypothetical protein
MFFTERNLSVTALAAGAAVAITLSSAEMKRAAASRRPYASGAALQLSLEQSRGVIFLSAAYLAE